MAPSLHSCLGWDLLVFPRPGDIERNLKWTFSKAQSRSRPDQPHVPRWRLGLHPNWILLGNHFSSELISSPSKMFILHQTFGIVFIDYNTIQYNTIQYSKTQYNTITLFINGVKLKLYSLWGHLSPVSVVLSRWESLTPPGQDTNPSQVSFQQMLVLIYLPLKDGKLS